MTDLDNVKAALRSQRIETPSWGYGNSGTRFKVFPQQGVPRNPYEKVDDAATVHRFTGAAPTVSLHIPWIGSTTTERWSSMPATRVCRSARSTRTRSRTTTTGLEACATRILGCAARR
jgi:L-rhamnose isomerase